MVAFEHTCKLFSSLSLVVVVVVVVLLLMLLPRASATPEGRHNSPHIDNECGGKLLEQHSNLSQRPRFNSVTKGLSKPDLELGRVSEHLFPPTILHNLTAVRI